MANPNHKEKVKILIEKFENHMKIDVHPHGSHVIPAETEKSPHSLDFSVRTRESHGGISPVCRRTFQPPAASIASGRLEATHQHTQPPHQSSYTVGVLNTDENKKTLCLNIPLSELISATLEFIDNDRDVRDLGIYVKSVIHRGEAGEADCLAVSDQITEVNGESLIGISKRSAMDRLHRAVELDGPTSGHIQLVVVRKVGGSSSVTHDATADDFVHGPNNQTFRETHHAKGIPSPWALDFGENVTSNLPINPNTDVIQHDYHQATFQHKPMQKCDLRMDCNVMMQNEIENFQESPKISKTSMHPILFHSDNLCGDEGGLQPGNPGFNIMDHDAHHAKHSPTKEIPAFVSHRLEYVDEKNYPIEEFNIRSSRDEQDEISRLYNQDKGFCNKLYNRVWSDSSVMSQPTSSHKSMQQNNSCVNPNDEEMESRQRMQSNISLHSKSVRTDSPISEVHSQHLMWHQLENEGPRLSPERLYMSQTSSLKDLECEGNGQQSTFETQKNLIDLSCSEVHQKHSIEQQVFSSSALNGNEIRMVILGKTGVGKSATGNTILGEKLFKSETSASSITEKCKQRSSVRFGHKVVVVDTPGSFDTLHTNEYIQEEICRCVAITSPGPHAFILVLNASRFTPEEQHSVNHFVKYFGDNIYKFIIILFTRKDDLDADEKNIFEYIRTSPPELLRLIQQCGGRYIAFNNRLKGQERDKQAEALLHMILKNVKENNCKCYTNEMYVEAEKILREKERKMERQAMEEHEKELQALEEHLAKRYEKKIAEDAEKLQHTQDQLECLTRKQKTDDEQILLLKMQVEASKQQVKGSEGEEKQKMQQRLDMVQKELENFINLSQKKDEEIKKLKKKKRKAQKDSDELHAEQRMERERFEKKLNEKFIEQNSKNRDVIRDEFEKNENVFHAIGTLWSCVKNKVTGWFGY